MLVLGIISQFLKTDETEMGLPGASSGFNSISSPHKQAVELKI